ncbi:putative non-specific serine/threonine protein kinase [Helianthus anomalus]
MQKNLHFIYLVLSPCIKFSKYVEFGETAAGFESLEMLDLSSNSFSGVIPSSIGNYSRLVVLNMSSNSLVGSVPSSLGGLKAANVIDSSHNLLNGSIQNEIGGAGLLEDLRLDPGPDSKLVGSNHSVMS